MNEFLLDLIKERMFFTSSLEREFIRDVKEQCCFVAANSDYFDEQATNFPLKRYKLPDGRAIEIGKEQFLCPDALFDTTLIDRDGESLQHVLHNALSKADLHIRKALVGNVVLAGGSTLFHGFKKRL